MQITRKLPFYVLLPRPWRVLEPMGCPTLEVQGLLSDLAEPAMTMAMDSSLEGEFITCSFLEREQSHGLPTAPCLKCTLAELDSTLDKVLGITGHAPVHPVDKLLLLLPPAHSLLQKFRNCLLISALSGSSHINSSLLKSYPLLGLNHVPPKLIFESLLLMALLGDSIIADDLVGESGITVVQVLLVLHPKGVCGADRWVVGF